MKCECSVPSAILVCDNRIVGEKAKTIAGAPPTYVDFRSGGPQRCPPGNARRTLALPARTVSISGVRVARPTVSPAATINTTATSRPGNTDKEKQHPSRASNTNQSAPRRCDFSEQGRGIPWSYGGPSNGKATPGTTEIMRSIFLPTWWPWWASVQRPRGQATRLGFEWLRRSPLCSPPPAGGDGPPRPAGGDGPPLKYAEPKRGHDTEVGETIRESFNGQ